MKKNVKVTYICHACLLIEIYDIKIITDPWIIGPCWADNIWQYPPPKINPEDISDIDFIYISHGHEDHLHSETLKRIDNNIKSKAKTIAPDFGKPYLKKALISNGLTNLEIMKNKTSFFLSKNIKATIFNCDNGVDDSSLLIETDEGNIFMQTDNLMSNDLAREIGSKYEIDIAFIMTSRTGIFPGFYELNTDKLEISAKNKTIQSYEIATAIIENLKPKYVVPYASDLCYLGELYYMNHFHRKSKNDFVNYVKSKNLSINTILLGPGDEINLLKKSLIKNKISSHDFDGKKLPLFGYKKRHEVYKYRKEEEKYNEIDIKNDIELFINKLNKASEKWSRKNFNILWQIDTLSYGIIELEHLLPSKIRYIRKKENKAYDLKLYIHGY